MSALSKNIAGKSGEQAASRKRKASAEIVTLKHLADRAISKSVPKEEAEKVCDALVGLVTKHLKKGDRIRIGGLGILMVTSEVIADAMDADNTGVIESETTPPADVYEPSARALALLRGKTIAEEDLKAHGGAFSLQEVIDFLGISRQAIDRKVRENALLSVPGPHKRRRYPVVQFDQQGIVPGLEAVLRSLPSTNDWFRLNFLVNEDDHLGGRRPIDVLKAGDVDRVIKAAEAVSLQGA